MDLVRGARRPGTTLAAAGARAPVRSGSSTSPRPPDLAAGGEQAPAGAHRGRPGRPPRTHGRERHYALRRDGLAPVPAYVDSRLAPPARSTAQRARRPRHRGPPHRRATAVRPTTPTRSRRPHDASSRPAGSRPRDGVRRLVIDREFRAPIEDVWAAVTESDRLERWIGTWTGDPASGAVLFRMTAEGDDAAAEDMEIRECDPPRRLARDLARRRGAVAARARPGRGATASPR